MDTGVANAPQAFSAAASLPLRLKLENVSKAFNGRDAIRDISLTVREHEFVALLGPSGAGKTTLLRCVAGLLIPDHGTVYVAGTDVSELHGRARRRVAVVFQQFNLVGRISALANVLAGRLGHVPAWRGITRRFERSDRLLALECLERVGLLEHAGQRADTLSGGQQQRVAIARALAQQPDIIVADEPVASLDPSNGAGILELLRGICREEGVSVLCSLHQVHLARQFADQLVGLSNGRIVLNVSAADFDENQARALYGAALEQ
jgi:phosphonate transport system ATP-binding protein